MRNSSPSRLILCLYRLWCIMLLILIACSTEAYSQRSIMPAAFLTPSSSAYGQLIAADKEKISRLRANADYDNVTVVGNLNLPEIQQNGVLPIAIPGTDKVVFARAKSIESVAADEYTWYGEFDEGLNGSVLIVKPTGRPLSGNIIYRDRSFKLLPLSGNNATLVEIKQRPFVADEACVVATPGPNDQVNIKPHASHKNVGPTEVTILVMFTPAAAVAGDPANDAPVLVAELNQIRNNSGLNANDINFTLVGVERLTGFVEQGQDIFDDVRRLRINNFVRNRRNALFADLVILLTDGGYGMGGTFGAAYQNQTGDEEFGYGIVEIDAPANRFTFAHEVAHTFGCKHDTDNMATGQVPLWARGRQFTAGGLQRNTLMAGATLVQGRIPNLSNPNVVFAGVATGVANQRDNARQMNGQSCAISEYRERPNPTQVYISGFNRVDNGQSSTWCAEITGCNTPNSIVWAYSYNGLNYTTSTTNRCITRTMPASGDMWLRVTVTCPNGTQATDTHYIRGGQGTGPIPDSTAADLVYDVDLFAPIGKLLNVFPNPTSNSLTLSYPMRYDETVTMVMTNSSGKVVKRTPLGEYKRGEILYKTVDLDLPAGIYVVSLVSGNLATSARVVVNRNL